MENSEEKKLIEHIKNCLSYANCELNTSQLNLVKLIIENLSEKEPEHENKLFKIDLNQLNKILTEKPEIKNFFSKEARIKTNKLFNLPPLSFKNTSPVNWIISQGINENSQSIELQLNKSIIHDLLFIKRTFQP